MHRAGEAAGKNPDGVPKYVRDANLSTILCKAKINGNIDRRFDSDFRTLQHLVKEKALGEVLEAELHFDHPNAGWIHGWTEKEYTPGKGMLFALGEWQHDIRESIDRFLAVSISG